MKKSSILLGILIFVLFLNFVSAEIRINEVELNPDGTSDPGNEWIELYSNNEVNLTDWRINDTDGEFITLNYTFSGYLILNVSHSMMEDAVNGLILINSSGFTIFSTAILNDSYNDDRTWQYCSGNWTFRNSTKNLVNNCTASTQTCNQSTSCMDFGNCLSSGTQTRTCVNTSTNCNQDTYTESRSCTYTSATPQYVLLNWTDNRIINSDEFKIEVQAFNLIDDQYDIKVEIHFNENDTGISERYNESDKEWKSGEYYVNGFFSVSGNKTKDISIRLKTDYKKFYGSAKIDVKLRKSGSVISEKEYPIYIIKKVETSSTEIISVQPLSTATAQNTPEPTPGVILLGSSKNNAATQTSKLENSIIYKSKSEYIKQYAPYAFGLMCVIIIIMLLIDKKQKTRSRKG